MLSHSEVLPVCSGPAIDSLADVLPPPLAQGRVPLGQGGRQGKGGTQGIVVQWTMQLSFRTVRGIHVRLTFVLAQLASSVIIFTGIMHAAVLIVAC